jgi:hypothetical protein
MEKKLDSPIVQRLGTNACGVLCYANYSHVNGYSHTFKHHLFAFTYPNSHHASQRENRSYRTILAGVY